MLIVVIGGTGHIGTYLIPRLVAARHQVILVGRGERGPYQSHPTWRSVRRVKVDREAAERSGSFGRQIAELNADVVIDLICFTLKSAIQLVTALNGKIRHFLHCGTIWVHGPSVLVPTTEEQPRRPFGEYGIQKAAIGESFHVVSPAALSLRGYAEEIAAQFGREADLKFNLCKPPVFKRFRGSHV